MSHRVEDALAALVVGNAIVVVDGDTGGNLVCAAESVSSALVAFLVRHTSGYLCVALAEADADRLGLPALRSGHPHAVSVDARRGTGTGISAYDRAHTARLLADPSTVADDLSRPGHVVPLRVRAGGVLEDAGHAEAAVDLMRLAGLRPAAILGAVVGQHDPVEMARPAELAEFAARYGLRMITIEELVAFLRPRHIEHVAQKRVRLSDAWFRSARYRDAEGFEHAALILGKVDGMRDVPVRIHYECLDGNVFGSLDCACSGRLRQSVAEIASHGRGILVYVREGAADSAAVTAGILRDNGVESVQSADACGDRRAHGAGVVDECRPGADAALQSVTGTVVHGDARGRELGFPTANLILDATGASLGDGVYGGWARVLGGQDATAWYLAAISVGANPTFRGREQHFEVHLLDFDGDLYGRRLEVVPLTLLRPTLAFDSPTALIAQIEGDLRALRTLATRWNHPHFQLDRV